MNELLEMAKKMSPMLVAQYRASSLIGMWVAGIVAAIFALVAGLILWRAENDDSKAIGAIAFGTMFIFAGIAFATCAVHYTYAEYYCLCGLLGK